MTARRVGMTADPLEALVRDAVDRHRLVRPGDAVVVAVSGGADSVALLHVLTRLRAEYALRLHVGHVHHGLRPEADRDAGFVQEIGDRLGCPVTVQRVTVSGDRGQSPEDAARRVRHAALEALATGLGARRIALGHTADDQAETVLMRVLQGAGVHGLAAMPARRGRLIRPFLGVPRDMVLAHVMSLRLPWVEDATNQDVRFLRNRIRHEVVPFLRARWPGLPDALGRLARASRETAEALDTLLAPRLSAAFRRGGIGFTLDLAAFRDLPAGGIKALLRMAAARLRDPAGEPARLRACHLAALTALVCDPVGSRVRLPGGLRVERARDALWFAPSASGLTAAAVAVPGVTEVGALGLRLVTDLGTPVAEWPADPAWEAWFDASALPAGLEVRPGQAGDRMVPFGSERPVRIFRLLAAMGVAAGARPGWPVLTTREGGGEDVVWVIGARRGARAPVTAGTASVLRVRAVVAAESYPMKEEST